MMRVALLATTLFLVSGEAALWSGCEGCERELEKAAAQLRQKDLRIVQLERELSKCRGGARKITSAPAHPFPRDVISRNSAAGKTPEVPRNGVKAKHHLKRAKPAAGASVSEGAAARPTKYYTVNVNNHAGLIDAVKKAPSNFSTEVTINILNDLNFKRQVDVSSGQVIHFVSDKNVTLNGHGKTRFFNISSGATSSFRLLVFEKGYTHSLNTGGGAILNNGNITTIRNCTFMGNKAVSIGLILFVCEQC